MDFSNYQPAPSVLEKLKNVDFVAVVGPTAVGKTTLMKVAEAIVPSIKMVLNNTSRAKRLGEEDSVDYHFRTKEEMLERIARCEYVQIAPSLLGEIYATAPEDYPAEGIGILAVLADAIPMFRALPFRSFRAIYILPPDWQEWQARMKAHGFEPDQLVKRLAEAKRSLTYAAASQDVQFVINDDVDRAARDFIMLVEGEALGRRQEAEQSRARIVIQGLLSKL